MFNKFRTDSAESKQLASHPISANATLVLVKFMLFMNRMNLVKGSPDKLISKMGVTPWEFRHGVKSLKEKDFIRKYTKWEYMINPDLMFNGDDRQYYIILHMWRTQTFKPQGDPLDGLEDTCGD